MGGAMEGTCAPQHIRLGWVPFSFSSLSPSATFGLGELAYLMYPRPRRPWHAPPNPEPNPEPATLGQIRTEVISGSSLNPTGPGISLISGLISFSQFQPQSPHSTLPLPISPLPARLICFEVLALTHGIMTFVI